MRLSVSRRPWAWRRRRPRPASYASWRPTSRRRFADCRYQGQSFELEVMAPDEGDTTSGLARAFHDAHRERYGYALPEEAIEVVNLRVRAEAPRPVFALPSVPPGRGSAEARRGERTV